MELFFVITALISIFTSGLSIGCMVCVILANRPSKRRDSHG